MSETSNNNENKKVVIELDNVRRDFLVGDETVHALKGVSFKIYEASSLPSWVSRVPANPPAQPAGLSRHPFQG